MPYIYPYQALQNASAADIYGRRPDAVNLANPSTQLNAVYPNLSGTNAGLSDEILRMIQGTDPNLSALSQNTGAVRGAESGIPGSQFAGRMGDLSLYDRLNQQRQAGIQAYNQTVPTVSGTQTNSPALQAQNQAQNNVWASAADPSAAANQALALYQQQLNQLSGSYSMPQTPSMPSIRSFGNGYAPLSQSFNRQSYGNMNSQGYGNMSYPSPGAGYSGNQMGQYNLPTAAPGLGLYGASTSNIPSGNLMINGTNPYLSAASSLNDFNQSHPNFNPADWGQGGF